MMRSKFLFSSVVGLVLTGLLILALNSNIAHAGGLDANGTNAATMTDLATYEPCPVVTAAATEMATTGTAVSTVVAATEQITLTPTFPSSPQVLPGYIGVKVRNVQGCGVRILEVRPGTTAQKAGLLAGDVIVAVDQRRVKNLDDLRQAFTKHQMGDVMILTIERDGEAMDFKVLLGGLLGTTPQVIATAAPNATVEIMQ